MSDVLEEHDEKVSIGGRNITNLRFAEDAVAEKEQELEAQTESLDRCKMEFSAEKTSLRTNSTNDTHRDQNWACYNLRVPRRTLEKLLR